MAEELLTKRQLMKLLEDEIRRVGGVTAFAREYSISQSYVSEVRKGDEEIGPAIQAALGAMRVERYMIVRPSSKLPTHARESPCPEP